MSESSCVDDVMLISLKELLADKFTLLVRTYLDDCTGRLARLNEAFTHGDLQVISNEAHGIKGSSRNIGANTLADFCGEIEDQTRKGDTIGLEQKMSAMQQQFAAVKNELNEYIK